MPARRMLQAIGLTSLFADTYRKVFGLPLIQKARRIHDWIL